MNTNRYHKYNIFISGMLKVQIEGRRDIAIMPLKSALLRAYQDVIRNRVASRILRTLRMASWCC